MPPTAVCEPFPIFQVGLKYLLYDVTTVMHIRREHHMCGVLIGNLPQAVTQNVYSGIPLELMPEEVRLLVEKGHGYLVDDVAAHQIGIKNPREQDRISYLQSLKDEGMEGAKAARRKTEYSTFKFLERSSSASPVARVKNSSGAVQREAEKFDHESLFEQAVQPVGKLKSETLEPMQVTPTLSYPLIKAEEPHPSLPLPKVPSSYSLYSYLHSKDYFLSPGLRFGCQYVAYPGDPLRYHSHFLVVGMEWDDEINLMDIVAGGRLGTVVKKSYMIGGKQLKADQEDTEDVIRAFSFEWAGM